MSRPVVAGVPAPAPIAAPTPTASVPPPAPVAVDVSDTNAIWNALLNAINDRPALSWMRWLRLVKLEGDTAHVAPVPGRRDVMKFLTERQKGQLVELLRPIVNRPIRIQLDAAAPTASAGDAAMAGDDGPPAEDETAGVPRLTPRQALSLPLVKQVMDVFDADLVEVRPAPKAAAPPAETSPSSPSGDSADDLPDESPLDDTDV